MLAGRCPWILSAQIADSNIFSFFFCKTDNPALLVLSNPSLQLDTGEIGPHINDTSWLDSTLPVQNTAAKKVSETDFLLPKDNAGG